MHEAAHFVAGVTLGAGHHDVFIRVPGRSPKHGIFRRGVAGSANVHGSSGEDDAIINLSAALVEIAVNGTTWQKRAASDLDSTLTWVCKREISGLAAIALCDRALHIVVNHWSAIDGAAAALLELGRQDGTVPYRRCRQVADYIRSGSWRSRNAHYSIPPGFTARLEAIRRTSPAFGAQ